MIWYPTYDTGCLGLHKFTAQFSPIQQHRPPLPPSRVLDHKAKQTWSIGEGWGFWTLRNPKCSRHVTWPKKEDVHMTKKDVSSLDSQIMVVYPWLLASLVSGWSLFGILGWSWVWTFSCTQKRRRPRESSQMVSLWMGIYDDISKDHVGSQHDIPYTRWARRRFLHGVLGPPINGRKIHGRNQFHPTPKWSLQLV